MKLEDLPTLLQLCPETTELSVEFTPENLKLLENISKFKKLENLKIDGFDKNLSPFTEFLKTLKNKLKKFTLRPNTKLKNNEKEILEFYKTLFEKTELEELHGIYPIHSKDIYSLISTWIETNSNLKVLHVECLLFIF
jgi:hypothetical protein